MIQDGIDYGEGYEKATEPGPEVEMRNILRGWGPRERPWQDDFEKFVHYRQPIKPKPIKLQVGEKYRMRNGEIVGPLIKKDFVSTYEFEDHRKTNSFSWNAAGIFDIHQRAHNKDIIEHIPKEKDMNEKTLRVFGSEVNYHTNLKGQYSIDITLSEAERLGAEAQRIKAENEIKVGDWIFFETQKLFLKVEKVTDLTYMGTNGFGGIKSSSTKITRPAHIQALNEIYEGMK